MNPTRPSLLTLIAWTIESAPQLRVWRESSADAEQFGALLVDVVTRLDAGDWLGESTVVSPDLVAAYLDGLLSDAETLLVEHACATSPAALAELISEMRLRRAPAAVAPSRTLEQRLLSLGPTASSAASSLPVGRAMSVMKSPSVASSSEIPSTSVRPLHGRTPRHDVPPRRSRRFAPWHVAAAALVLLAAVGSVVAVIVARRPVATEPDSRVAEHPSGPRPSGAPLPERTRPESSADDRLERFVDRPRSSAPAPDSIELPLPEAENTPPPGRGENLVQTPPLQRPAPPLPRPVDPTPPGSIPRINVQSDLGVLLVQSGPDGRWRVGRDSYPLDQPLTLTSLDESWGTAEIPDVGTLVYQGEAKATMRIGDDGGLRIDVEQGKLGLRNLAAGKRVSVRTANSQFSAVSVAPYSTMAIVHDPLAPAAFVSSGIIDVGGASLASNEFVRFNGLTMSSPQPLAVARSLPTPPFASNPFDVAWMTAPAERQKKEWRAQHGKLADRLDRSDDVLATLRELRAEMTDARQLALLARWSVTLADDKGSAVWEMLNDRQELVRVAGVERLLELPQRVKRDLLTSEQIRGAVGDAAADSLIQWMIAAQGSKPLSAAHARDMVGYLQHQHLAMRQVAVSLLEHYSTAAFQQARRKPPNYDAAAPANKRAAAQLEWRRIIAQLYLPNRANKSP